MTTTFSGDLILAIEYFRAAHLARHLALGLMLALLTGCSNSTTSEEPPHLVPVTGTVTYKEQLVPGARVVFHPVESMDVGDAAFAETDAQGRFNLLMQDYGSGAVPGDYVVTVLHPTDNLPGTYETRDSSPLRATVENKAQNEIPLVLED